MIDHFTQAGESGFQFRKGQGDGVHVVLGLVVNAKKPMHRMRAHGLWGVKGGKEFT